MERRAKRGDGTRALYKLQVPQHGLAVLPCPTLRPHHQMASRLAPTSGPLHSSPLLSALAQLLPQDPGTVLPGPESQLHQLRDWVPQFPHHKIKTVLGPSREDSCRCEPTNTCLVLAQALAHWPLTQFRTTPTGRCFPPCLHCSALTTHFSGAPAPTPPPAPHTPELTELPSPSPAEAGSRPSPAPSWSLSVFPQGTKGALLSCSFGDWLLPRLQAPREAVVQSRPGCPQC